MVDTGATTGDITIAEIAGDSGETVTLDAGTGTTSVGPIGTGTEIGTLTIGSAANGAITLNGAIITDGEVNIDGPVTLATTSVSITTTDDDITFEGTIDGGQALTLSSGSGDIDLQGDIGTASGGALSSLTINNSNGASGTISLPNIGTSSAVGVSGATDVGNTSTGTLTFNGTVYKTTGGQDYTAATGGNNIVISGGNQAVGITTSGGTVAFNTSDVILHNDAATTITTAGGGVSFGAKLETDGGDDDSLVISSGAGDVSFTGAIGVTNELGGLTINNSAGGWRYNL